MLTPWKPFGTGLRACIGRSFAWQEALLVTALLLQNFNISLDDPSYQMKIQQSLTIKPKGCYIRATLRPGIMATSLQERLSGSSALPSVKNEVREPRIADPEDGLEPMTILFGSNTGTCQALAQTLALEAASRGYRSTVTDMDSAIEKLPVDQPVVIITASYEGQPPDNAARFVAWLESLDDHRLLKSLRCAVFGCGHADWGATYQRIPHLVDSLLADCGGFRIAERGICDVSKRNMSGDFAAWTDRVLWTALFRNNKKEALPVSVKLAAPSMNVEITTQQRAAHLQQKLQWANITAVQVLTGPEEPEKRHIEFQLPSDVGYQTGDYLAVLPLNPDEIVRRVMKQFSLPWDAVITISNGGPTTLPTNVPISAFELLRGYVELSQPASMKVINLRP